MADKEAFSYNRLHDHQWLRQSFMIAHDTQVDYRGDPIQEDVHVRTRFFTTAMFKFSDTTLGGNIVINPHPQFTRTADPRVKGLYQPSEGMGRYYSEAIDDHKRYISMIFGVPQFNSLTSFYKGFYNSDAAIVARTGRGPSAFFRVGQAVGFVVGLLSPWLVVYSVASAFIKWAVGANSTKYYFMKPTMPLYWNAVSMIANDLAVKTQLVTRRWSAPVGSPGDSRQVLSDQDVRDVNQGIASLIDSYDDQTGTGNGINVYAVATRAQRIQRKAYKALEDYYNSGDAADSFLDGKLVDESFTMQKKISEALAGNKVKNPRTSFFDYLKTWSEDGPGVLSGSKNAKFDANNPDAPATPEGSFDLLTEKSIGQQDSAEQDKWYNFLAAELDDGAQYVSFRVENTGDAQESFSNQAGDPEIAGKINSISGSARSTRFSMADGNVGDGLFASVTEFVGGAVKDIASGAAQSLGLDGLAALGGNAFVDIPKYWTGSTTSMPRMSYTVRLNSPYGNRYSKFINIWLPLSMLLAAALPLSTGAHSYTSPFLCQVFDRGRAQTRLGMIDSMSITRGKNNLAFNQIGEPMSVEVQFSVVELSSILHMPIQQEFKVLDVGQIFERESLYNDYIAVLSSLSLAEQIYVGERIKIGLTKYLKNMDSYFSVAHAMNWVGDMGAVRVFSMFFDGIANR